jgi:hypothetical protein
MTSLKLESDKMSVHPLVSWRSIIAGLLVTFFSLAILLSLGIAFGGIGLSGGTDAQNAGFFTGVWFLISSVISLFLGSYFAARISMFHTNRIGSAQGLVIVSLFFGFFLYQTASAIGWAGKAAGSAVSSTVSAASTGASRFANNSVVNSIIENAVGDLNLRSDPQTVVTGLGNRLIRGNTVAARNYLARQSNLSPAEADQRIATLRTQVDQALVQAREAAAKALQATGWSLFATMLLGLIASVGGGALGSLQNVRHPLVHEQTETYSDFHAAPV